MERKVLIPALVFLGFGAVYGYLTTQLIERTLSNTPGPSFFPWLLTAALILLSLALLVQGYLGPGPAAREEKETSLKAPASGLLLFAVYLIALPFIGFLLASVPFFAGMMAASGARSKTVIAAAAIAIPLFLFFLFQYGFQIPMPQGSILDW